MSFRTTSAILRGRWLIDKQWANAHMPLVFGVLKGDAKAAELLGITKADAGSDDEDENDEEVEAIPVNIGKNVYKVSPFTTLSELPDGIIAFVDIDGPMLKQGDWCSYGSEDYAEMFYGLMSAPNVLGVILDIDSPGGQADGTATFADAIKACAAVKPVIGFVDDGMAASAAYWDISACTEIYVSQPTDQVGSIGVYCSIADWNAYYKSQGLPVKDVYAPQSTDKNGPYRESIEGNDDLLQQELSVMADAFIATVRKNRKGKISGSDWATGKMYFSDDALKMGLIDGIKTFDQVVFRLNRLISSQQANNSNNNTMAFEKTLAAAKATADNFLVVGAGSSIDQEGILVQESHLQNIEAHLASQETAAANLQEQLSTATVARETADAALATANETVSTQASRIQELEHQVKEMSGQPAGEFKATNRDQDELPGSQGEAYHLSDKDPFNQMADKVLPKKS